MRSKRLAIGLSLLLVSSLLVACGPERGPALITPQEPTPERGPAPPPEQPGKGGPSISVEKMVSIDGGANWVDQVEQIVGQNVQFQITVLNDGDVPLSNIVISDYLPDCLEYVDGPAVEAICKTQLPYLPYYNLPGTNTPTWKCSELAPGNSVQVIYTAHVVESGMCKNQVSVEGEYDEEIVTAVGSATVTGITGQPPGWDDWGDAPDPYPTLNASNGAYHQLNGPWLGSARDGEPDGQPDASALGDDNAGLDDEDGITGLTSIFTGLTSTITIVVSGGGGYVQAWIDWNSDGDWLGSNEQIFNSYLPDGTHTITVAVPSNAVVGQTFARFRINTLGNLSTTGEAKNGEVEDYAVVIEEGQPPVPEPVLTDWGDAPDPYYPTLNASNGAYHLLNGPWLGSARDGEPDGLPDALALGDDNNGNDDEDGVTFTYHQDINTLDIEILVSGGGGYVQAWIDWNIDGDWQDMATTNIPYNDYINLGYRVDGSHTISLYVPSSLAATLETFARFRISLTGGLLPTGGADNGEVEDYELSISY